MKEKNKVKNTTNNKAENKAENKVCHRGIFLFFLAVITIGTALNLSEFLRRSEPDGRMAGLNQLSTVEDAAINLWGGFQKILGKQVAYGSTFYEDVTLLKNGYATMADQDPDYTAAVEGAEGAYALAQEIGAEFLYVQTPAKQRYEEEFPEGVINYSMSKHEGAVSSLRQTGIPLVDMREVMEQSGEEWYDYFYRSDHHWRNNAAFLAYQEICAYMEACGMPVNREYLEQSQYEKILYEDVFLGTHARMAGTLYAGLDDYELWLPLFDTSFTLDVASQGIHLEGDFEDCFVHYENLDHPSFDYYAYYAYLKEDFDRFEIVNHNNPEGAHVLIVRDSSAVPVSVFLASQCSELDILDLRYSGEQDMISYIREQQPDLILYIFGPGYLGNKGAVILR